MPESGDSTAKIEAALDAYELGTGIGEGAFARVYAGTHRYIGRPVAIKVLDPQFTHDEQLRHRFQAEAQVLGRLDHPHIIRVFDYVERDDVCAFVMERLPGGTVSSRGLLGGDPATACAVAVSTLSALQYGHNRGVVHRDIKPSNVMFTDQPIAKVGDFGIARIIGGGATFATAPGAFLGTPMYMAPEQVAAGEVGPATDCYAVGVMLYELLTGTQPFDATGGYLAVAERRLTERPPRPFVAAPLADVVMRSLEREPGDRFDSAHHFASALVDAASSVFGVAWLSSVDLKVSPPDRPATLPSLSGQQTVNPAQQNPRPSAQLFTVRGLLRAVGGLVMLSVLALAPTLIFGKGAEPHPHLRRAAVTIDGQDLSLGHPVRLSATKQMLARVDGSRLPGCSSDSRCIVTDVRLRVRAASLSITLSSFAEKDGNVFRVRLRGSSLVGSGRVTGQALITTNDRQESTYSFPAEMRDVRLWNISYLALVLLLLLAIGLAWQGLSTLCTPAASLTASAQTAAAGALLSVALQMVATLFLHRDASIVGLVVAVCSCGAASLGIALRAGRRRKSRPAQPLDDRTRVVAHRQTSARS